MAPRWAHWVACILSAVALDESSFFSFGDVQQAGATLAAGAASLLGITSDTSTGVARAANFTDYGAAKGYLYRAYFTKTFGDDHVCMTELEFWDANNTPMQATYLDMSTCYGCSTCDNCTHRYGIASALFDGVATVDDEYAWVCTAPGTFSTEGMGSQHVSFFLPGRPDKWAVTRPSANGDWVSKDFSLEERQQDGDWWVVDQITDSPKSTRQFGFMDYGAPAFRARPPMPLWFYNFPKAWRQDYPDCAGSLQSPIELDEFPLKSGGEPLPYSYVPMMNAALANTGTGLQVAGRFGTLTLPDGVYDAKQFHFHMPAEHKINSEGRYDAVGEMHIVHQRRNSTGTSGLAMVAIMLHLPKEHTETNREEKWFMDLGMLAPPEEGVHSYPFVDPVDLSFFKEQLDGNYWYYSGSLTTPPCTENVHWFVMDKFAHISGATVNAFKLAFPDPKNARGLQTRNSRPVLLNQLPQPPTDEDADEDSA